MAKLRNKYVYGLLAIAFLVAVAFATHGILWGIDRGETFSKVYKLTLTDYSGHEVKLAAYKNKILIAYTWASWCPYCAAEMQNLQKIKESYGDQVQIIAVNRGEPNAEAIGFSSKLGKTDGMLLLLDPSDSFFKAIVGYAMPETVFVKQNGDVLYHQRGPMRPEDVTQRLKELIAARSEK